MRNIKDREKRHAPSMRGRGGLRVDGMIFNIQRFSLHDGPGIRTTVFLSGCNLRCRWCHNPESFTQKPVVRHFPMKCIGCAKCIEVCPQHCHISVNGVHQILRQDCVSCGKCAEACYAGALEMSSRRAGSDEILSTVLLDRPFYKETGGMTVSGGEPMLQSEFALALLRGAKEAGVSTALDTAGAVPFERYEAVLPYVDLFLYDMKCMDPQTHRKATGVDNALILENLPRLCGRGARVLIRVPVIPGVNDSEDNMAALGAFLAPLEGIEGVELLPYHPLGGGKYESLGLSYPSAGLEPPSREAMEALCQVVCRSGVDCKIS